jgi:hypothetical protein
MIDHRGASGKRNSGGSSKPENGEALPAWGRASVREYARERAYLALWRFFRSFFFRLCVAIFLRFLFFPQGTVFSSESWVQAVILYGSEG